MLKYYLFASILASVTDGLPSLNLLGGPDGYIIKEYINAITAYGPGLGVYTPYQYVDVSYDNIPFVGKIPTLGKEGTSSGLGISPFYPPQGNPSNPFPPLYRARPLPLHVPEPQDVVAVPLDEEALHGEPLFPPELLLPGEQIESETDEEQVEQPENPFGGTEDSTAESMIGFVNWLNPAGTSSFTASTNSMERNTINDKSAEDVIITDRVLEQNTDPEQLKTIKPGNGSDRPKSPFRSKRVRRFARFLY